MIAPSVIHQLAVGALRDQIRRSDRGAWPAAVCRRSSSRASRSGPSMNSSPTSPGCTGLARFVEDRASRRRSMAWPIGIAVSSSAGDLGQPYARQTLVSVGPNRFQKRGLGQSAAWPGAGASSGRPRPRRRPARSEGAPRSARSRLVEHQDQRRRDRVPDADACAVGCGRACAGPLTTVVSSTIDDRGAHPERGPDVEDGEVEVERRHAGHPIRVVELDLIGRPLDERERVAVREHHALGHARGARRVEQVGEARPATLDWRQLQALGALLRTSAQ